MVKCLRFFLVKEGVFEVIFSFRSFKEFELVVCVFIEVFLGYVKYGVGYWNCCC